MTNEETIKLIATKIMEWHLEEETIVGFITYCWRDKEGNIAGNYGSSVVLTDLFDPFFSAEDWILIVDKLVEQGWIFTLSCYPKVSFFGDELYVPYRAVFGHNSKPDIFGYKSDKLGEAICGAALKIIGVEL